MALFRILLTKARESGIPLTQTDGKSNNIKKHISIPVRKPVKVQSKRVGARKEKTIAASKVFITEESYLADTFEKKIVEEPVNKEMLLIRRLFF